MNPITPQPGLYCHALRYSAILYLPILSVSVDGQSFTTRILGVLTTLPTASILDLAAGPPANFNPLRPPCCDSITR